MRMAGRTAVEALSAASGAGTVGTLDGGGSGADGGTSLSYEVRPELG